MSRVFIGNLRDDCREKDIEKLFRDYGRITDIYLKGTFGFVNFDDQRDASYAIKDLDGERFDGRRLQVEFAKGGGIGKDGARGRGGGRDGGRSGDGGRGMDGGRGRGPPQRSQYRLIIENLSSRTSWQDLKDYMRKAGDVFYTDIDKYSREGVVEFADRRGMEKAIYKLDDTDLDGRWIRVREDRRRDRSESGRKDRSERGSSGRRDRSRSRSRSRSGERRSRSRSRSDSRSRSRSRSRSEERRDRSRSKSEGRSSRYRSKSRSTSRRSRRSNSKS